MLSAAILGLCLQWLATPEQAPVRVPGASFTLAWQHSIEKVRWEENYSVLAPAGAPAVLQVGRARIKGSAAGMEPPADARLEKGWYVYQPADKVLSQLVLTRSGFTPDYELCIDDQPCQSMDAYLPSDGGQTRLWVCAQD